MKTNWSGRNIVILGAARQGVSLARYMAAQSAVVTLNDLRPVEQMQSAQEALQGLPIRWELGGHPLSILDGADLLCISGGVPLTNPLVIEAERRGLPISNDSQIFMEAVNCPVVGITGSAGKTTTTTLVGRMARYGVTPPRKVWIGGNIGRPLIEFVDQMQPDDLVILELSSFQLEQMTISPSVSAVLNITPNHLDRHGTLEAYTAAKAHILTHQTAQNVAILNREDPGSWGLLPEIRGRLVSFGLNAPEVGQTGTYRREDRLFLQIPEGQVELMPQSDILLRGEHNVTNVLAACAIAWSASIPLDALRAGVSGFQGVAHRLEFVRELNGAKWYNDSIATAPERTMAAVRSFTEPLVLLLGGRDKKLPWEDLAEMIHERVDHVVLFGEAAGKISAAIGSVQPGRRPYSIHTCAGLADAVATAAEVAENGDVVLLSPGGTSYDEFHDFEERGERFQEWVNKLS